jgi:hypothetical protein
MKMRARMRKAHVAADAFVRQVPTKNAKPLATAAPVILSVMVFAIVMLAGCERSDQKASSDASSSKASDNAELFTIPQDQMAHVQVLKVQPTNLTRTLRLTGAMAYNSFRTTL